jgi:hypothetical protein
VSTAAIVPPLAARFGRVRLPCSAVGNVEPSGWVTCALNRGFVSPDTLRLAIALGDEMAREFSGSRVTTLEASFPFIDGFPLPPHLSHRDGRKIDVAFFYKRADTGQPVPAGSPSLLGYFVYEQPLTGESASCGGRWTPLRWNFSWFQPSNPVWQLDERRTAAMISWLVSQPEVVRVFVEPYLATRLGVAGGKVRFQGCWAARHDDHLHIEVR